MERAEEWGDQVLQPVARRIAQSALARAPRAVASYLEGARLPLPAPVARLSAPLVPRLSRRVNRVNDSAVRADLLALPAHLARVEGWIEDGTLGGDTPNAGDIQIGASLRLLLTFGDLAPAGALPLAWLPASVNGEH